MIDMRVWNPDGDGIGRPLRWRKPGHVRVEPRWGDLFYSAYTDTQIERVFAVMAATPDHTYHLVTENPDRMRGLLTDRCECGAGHPPGVHFMSAMDWASTSHSPTYIPGLKPGLYHRVTWPVPNVWVAVRVTNQETVNLFVPPLLRTPAAVRYLLMTGMTGQVDLTDIHAGAWVRVNAYTGEYATPDGQPPSDQMPVHGGIDWVVAGAGPDRNPHPVHPGQLRDLRDQCRTHQVPFTFLGWGEHLPAAVEEDDRYACGRAFNHPLGGRQAALIRIPGRSGTMRNATARPLRRGDRTRGGHVMLDDHTIAVKVGRDKAGRQIDGQTWDQMPGHYNTTPQATTLADLTERPTP